MYVDHAYPTDEVVTLREIGAASGAGGVGDVGYADAGRRVSLVRGNGTVTRYGLSAV